MIFLFQRCERFSSHFNQQLNHNAHFHILLYFIVWWWNFDLSKSIESSKKETKSKGKLQSVLKLHLKKVFIAIMRLFECLTLLCFSHYFVYLRWSCLYEVCFTFSCRNNCNCLPKKITFNLEMNGTSSCNSSKRRAPRSDNRRAR